MMNQKDQTNRSAFLSVFSVALVLSLGLFVLSSMAAAPGPYARARVTRTPTPTPGTAAYSITALGSQANGINTSGQVTGILSNSHAFLWTPSQPNGTSGTLSDLGTLGGTISLGKGLNDSGQVAGYSTRSDGSYRAFLFGQGVMTDLGVLDGNYSAGYGINAGGQVAGSAYVTAGGSTNEHAMLWTPDVPNGTTGVMIDLGTLGGEYSTARGINLNGRVVGYAYLANGAFHAYVYANGILHDLGTLGGSYSQAYGINDAGQVVGQGYLSGNTAAHAFLWQKGSITDLGILPGGNYSSAFSLTSDGQEIVGESTVPGGPYLVYHAFLYSNGLMQDLNNLIPANSGWVLESAAGINNTGQIVGNGTLNGVQAGFLLTPVQ